MTSSKLLNFAKLQFLDLQELWALLSKSGVREGEEMAGWEYTDLIVTLVLGVRDLLNPDFSCRKVDSIGQKLALLLHVFNF